MSDVFSLATHNPLAIDMLLFLVCVFAMQKRIWMRGIIIFWGVTLGYGVNEGLMVRYCEPGNPTPGEATAFRLDVPAGLIGTFCLDVTNTRREPITANILAVDGAVDANGL